MPPTDRRLEPDKKAGTERITEGSKAKAARANATLRTKKQIRVDKLRESRIKKRDRGMDVATCIMRERTLVRVFI